MTIRSATEVMRALNKGTYDLLPEVTAIAVAHGQVIHIWHFVAHPHLQWQQPCNFPLSTYLSPPPPNLCPFGLLPPNMSSPQLTWIIFLVPADDEVCLTQLLGRAGTGFALREKGGKAKSRLYFYSLIVKPAPALPRSFLQRDLLVCCASGLILDFFKISLQC